MHASVTGALATTPEELARQLGATDAFFAMRDRVLGEAVKGAIYGVAITEREAGSRLSALRTTYEREGDGYRLRGQKAVCSGAGHLDGYLVAARAAGAGEGEDPCVSYFLLPGGEGLTVDETWNPLGMRSTASNGFALNARVPADALVGVEGLAVLLAYALPQWLVASYAAVYVSVAEAALAEASSYLSERVAVPHGRPDPGEAWRPHAARLGQGTAQPGGRAGGRHAPGPGARRRRDRRAPGRARHQPLDLPGQAPRGRHGSAGCGKRHRGVRVGGAGARLGTGAHPPRRPLRRDHAAAQRRVRGRARRGGAGLDLERRQAMVSAAIIGVGTACPGVLHQDALWDGFFRAHYGGSALARRLWFRSGVQTRHGVVDPRDEDLSTWGTAARMRRFVAEAVPLGKAAVSGCLADAKRGPADVDLLAVVTCTGYATPGLDVLLARDLGMRRDVQRLAVGHMGCYAALPGLAAVADAAVARGRVAVLLCLELTSLHIQPPTTDVDQIVSHALFSDAAAAIMVAPAAPGLHVVDVVARTDTLCAELMTWDVTDNGFRMGLSPQVPRVLDRHVAEVVGDLLADHGLEVSDVAGWAIHPGGPRIVDVVARRLGLGEAQVAVSRQVLRDHGNCSSATVPLILERLRPRLRDGDHVACLAFGPGLTLYAALLRAAM